MTCSHRRRLAVIPAFALALAACASPPDGAAAAPPFHVTASVQELMDAVIDTSADGVWDAVATTITRDGTEEHQPRSPEQWQEVRRHAITLLEGTNLLLMDGRPVSHGYIASEGPGVFDSRQIQAKLDAERPLFIALAQNLRIEVDQALAAIDARDPRALLAAGGRIDVACEQCHATFWYPNQILPAAPVNAKPSGVPASASTAPAAPGPAPPPAPRGPTVEVALAAARYALAACLEDGYRVGVTVVDSAGAVRLALAQDGARQQALDSSAAKALTVVRYRQSSGAVAQRVAADAALAAEVAADPKLRARAGALPLWVEGELIGALGVGGAPGAEKDEACAQRAIASVQERLR